MVSQQRIFFDFLRFCIGVASEIPESLKGADWKALYAIAKKQALIGVLFHGIKQLPKEMAPDTALLMQWMGNSMAIEKRNAAMYLASLEVFSEIRNAGYRCCILKGQGNAVGYPNPYSRMPGDVDVWVLTENRKELRQLALGLADAPEDVEREIVQHIELKRKGVVVELHPTPMMFNNPVLNHRMQRWFRRNADLQCSNLVDLPDGIGQIAVPTATFNAIYQLSHLYHHFFYEGVGMRQMIDYYYVLKGLPQISQRTQIFKVNTSRTNNTNGGCALEKGVKYLGLWKFAGAVMWVLHEILGLPSEHMIVPMDEIRGRQLLDEILKGGNFGQHSNRQHYGRGTMGHNVQRILRDLQLIRYYPAEAMAEPFFRVWHFFWRVSH